MKALIDGDLLVYRIGYTTEDVDSNIAIFRLNTFIEEIVEGSGADHYTIYLTSDDKSNFRYALDSQYKANRTQPKPRYYHVLRNSMVKKHGAKIVFNMEADDQLGIDQNQDTIIVSIDKDLDQIPGQHYNFLKKKIYDITPLEGLQWFYKQILIGDMAVDNVEGLYGIGPKKAAKAIDPLMDEISMYDKVCDMYKEKHPDDYLSRVLKAGQLLKIKQSEQEGLWQPPKK